LEDKEKFMILVTVKEAKSIDEDNLIEFVRMKIGE